MLMTGDVSHILETGSPEPVDSRAAFGARVAEARTRLGISRAELARRVGTAASHISMLERGRAGASLENTSGIARELKVSVDYLFGFTEDPTPAADLQHELRERKAEIHDLRAGTAPPEPSEETWTEYVGIVEVDTAAGVGAVVGNEQVTGLAKFSHAWLRSQGLIASRCRIMRVSGESMEPTLPDGCGILVNLEATERKDGKIFVIRVGDELRVKRAVNSPEAGWLLVSDHPDKRAWPSLPWPDEATVIGEVRWLRRSFA